MRHQIRPEARRYLPLRRSASGLAAGLVAALAVGSSAGCSAGSASANSASAGPSSVSPSSADSASAGATQAGPTVAVSGGSACAGAPNSATTRTIQVGGQSRTFIEHLPPAATAATAATAAGTAGAKLPAIIAFPGRGETDSELEAYSRLDGVNAVVLYAQGLNGEGAKSTWEATPYLGDSAHDYEFANDLVRWLAQAPCVDATRIDLTGKSDGAGFAASAACTISGVAAVATISGAFYQDSNHCTATGHPLPVLNLHGSSDWVIPYDGNPARRLYGTDAWLQLWRRRDKCTGAGAEQTLTADVTQTTWSGCADGSVVVNDRIAGGGHTWTVATAPSGPGASVGPIDSAQTIAAFFTAHPLPEAKP
ncbi:polyhydroxybutyrate depolymerase [Kitasatospora sp. GP30]|uniref:alpha/beta hydrolase family esterase n=1 Tax=Kitasatospora sp. GP30 TaxID=3035084 RepID=UPI000CBAFEB6|nr:acyl-CoA thioester hydrolase/BAAT C-terminal domain-containing protein [Kitasatospora sp. GP30]MDH6142876.1 polyhydroxybutyrate depolymerase [Kitasatospora sp. GP30]